MALCLYSMVVAQQGSSGPSHKPDTNCPTVVVPLKAVLVYYIYIYIMVQAGSQQLTGMLVA